MRGEKADFQDLPEGKVSGSSSYAYLMEWHEYYSPKALHQILASGIRAKSGYANF